MRPRPGAEGGELWHYENISPDLVQGERVHQVLYSGKTKYQHVVIQDTACFGRTLVLDNKTQSTELDDFVYHEALVHPAMIAHPNPRQVFVAGGGEGSTIREVLAHGSVDRIVMVDIDRELVELCKRYLPNHHRGAFDDRRVELHHADALGFLQDTEDTYDVAIIDVPDPLEGGPAYLLFTREFYELLKGRLNSGGMIVAQSGPTGPAFYEMCFSAIWSTMGGVFPLVVACETFVPSFGTTWGFIIGSLGPDPSALSAEEVDRLISTRVGHPLRLIDGITHAGMFALPKYLRDAMDAETRVITRENPLFVE